MLGIECTLCTKHIDCPHGSSSQVTRTSVKHVGAYATGYCCEELYGHT